MKRLVLFLQAQRWKIEYSHLVIGLLRILKSIPRQRYKDSYDST